MKVKDKFVEDLVTIGFMELEAISIVEKAIPFICKIANKSKLEFDKEFEFFNNELYLASFNIVQRVSKSYSPLNSNLKEFSLLISIIDKPEDFRAYIIKENLDFLCSDYKTLDEQLLFVLNYCTEKGVMIIDRNWEQNQLRKILKDLV